MEWENKIWHLIIKRIESFYPFRLLKNLSVNLKIK
ncbi:hypothetical protein predicted by Glimmer [Lactococcus cremoris subsp. cremoris MG1363]|uniref:Uncharacterized protein n=1 Tax=Lactococcus lactis subsp. cremoris (strain MG1363) TaxID=416870 RepID=A2RNH6_LACLM|nr:hypothetical protein predicted by Glimmer [Lactococcus cremoris subsp. cremoris MG1363]